MNKIKGEISNPKLRVMGINTPRKGANTGSTSALVIQ